MKRYKPRSKIVYQTKQNHQKFNIYKLNRRKWFFLKRHLYPYKFFYIKNPKLKKFKNKKIPFFIKKVIKIRKFKKYKKVEKRKDFFRENLFISQQLKFFYGDLSDKKFKKLISMFFKKKKIFKQNDFISFFRFLETRLDIVLFRLQIAKSIFHAKQLISHKKISVNSKIITCNNFYLKKGDTLYYKKFLNFNKKEKVSSLVYEKKKVPSLTYNKDNSSLLLTKNIKDIHYANVIKVDNKKRSPDELKERYGLKSIMEKTNCSLSEAFLKKFGFTNIVKNKKSKFLKKFTKLKKKSLNYLDFNIKTKKIIFLNIPKLNDIKYPFVWNSNLYLQILKNKIK